MKRHPVLLSVLLLLSALSIGHAEIRVLSAYFGRPNNAFDVTGVLQNYAYHGIYSFRVNGKSMGFQANPGREDYLRVVYNVNGKRYTTDAKEGQKFTFVGIGDPKPWDGTAIVTVQIVNSTAQPLGAYKIDQWGGWHWQAQVSPGQTASNKGVVGQGWVVADLRGNIVKRFEVGSRGSRVLVGGRR